ncbi:MAG: lipopolysaccharide biosynthesis protein [Rhodobacteraceae bacterium]|nr:lipopolysaccharide biosynthesis protein [Paracoccaceae bacterium]
MTDLFVTNYNPNFTGVSATAANVIRQQVGRYPLALVGQPLPGCPAPLSRQTAHAQSRAFDGKNRPFAIWHVRRNTEMRSALWLRDVRRAPVRIVFTSAAQRLHSAFPRWLISRMDAVIATTEEAARFVPHVRAVVPHGVDTDRFTPPQDRAAAWQALGFGGKQGIATIGRIRPEKGTDRFVDAMLRLLPNHPDTVALVIGRADRRHQSFLDGLKAQVRSAGLGDRLLFPGELPATELPALVQGLSLVMQLPRYEGYGMAPLEGMAAGVPFVATDAGYYRVFADEGRAGSIVPPDDPAAAAAAAETLLSDATPARSALIRKLAESRFSARAEAEGIDAVYQSLWAR